MSDESEGPTKWERQKAELEAYNTFYSAYTGRVAVNSFNDAGYVVAAEFPEINLRDGVAAYPDFVLFDGSVFLNVEVKSGNNVEERHIEQVKTQSKVTIETAEDYLKDWQIPERFGYDTDVDSIESCIVYDDLDEDYVASASSESPEFPEKFQELHNTVPVLAQDRGSTLRLLEGEFSSDELQSQLTEGIALPEQPKKQVFLTDGCEVESIAVAVCHVWGPRSTEEEVTLDVNDVVTGFPGRNADPHDVKTALDFLADEGLCPSQEVEEPESRLLGTEYVFNVMAAPEILDIERMMDDLGSIDEGEQSSLGRFD